MESQLRDPNVNLAPLGVMHLRYIEMFQAILQAGTLTDGQARFLDQCLQEGVRKVVQRSALSGLPQYALNYRMAPRSSISRS
jgi:hypothetical protein